MGVGRVWICFDVAEYLGVQIDNTIIINLDSTSATLHRSRIQCANMQKYYVLVDVAIKHLLFLAIYTVIHHWIVLCINCLRY